MAGDRKTNGWKNGWTTPNLYPLAFGRGQLHVVMQRIKHMNLGTYIAVSSNEGSGEPKQIDIL